MSATIDTKRIANHKLDNALKLIEQAQNFLGLACQELSPLLHACPQWELVGKEYDRVHSLWRKIAYTTPRNKIDLDSENKRALEAPTQAKGVVQ